MSLDIFPKRMKSYGIKAMPNSKSVERTKITNSIESTNGLTGNRASSH